ncbi:unnamed protein product, partial [Linum tenue]
QASSQRKRQPAETQAGSDADAKHAPVSSVHRVLCSPGTVALDCPLSFIVLAAGLRRTTIDDEELTSGKPQIVLWASVRGER